MHTLNLKQIQDQKRDDIDTVTYLHNLGLVVSETLLTQTRHISEVGSYFASEPIYFVTTCTKLDLIDGTIWGTQTINVVTGNDVHLMQLSQVIKQFA